MFDVDCIRADFPIFDRKINGKTIVYFDNAATTQRPKQVVEKVREFYYRYNANIHRGNHTLSQEASELYDKAHQIVADFINANSMEEIIFVRNASEALNLVAYAYGLNNLKRGDKVVVSIGEHHSNIVPWQFLRDFKGIVLNFVRTKNDGSFDLEALEKAIDERTRIVSIVHVSNVTGVINPIKEITKIAHEKGAIVVVDGAQSTPHLPVNVKELDVDFYAASGHKMLGPTGIGFLYGKKELLEKMNPFLFGGGMIRDVTTKKTIFNQLPWKFEAGTPNIAGAIGLAEAIKYLQKIGMAEILEHEHRLIEYAMIRLSEIDEVVVYGPKDIKNRVGVLSFNIKGYDPIEVSIEFDREGIAIRSGHHCAQPLLREVFGVEKTARASFYLYNKLEEIDRMVETIEKLVRRKKP